MTWGLYLWNEKVSSNYFCKTCGIFTYIGDGENAQDGYRVNLGCVEGLDPPGSTYPHRRPRAAVV